MPADAGDAGPGAPVGDAADADIPDAGSAEASSGDAAPDVLRAAEAGSPDLEAGAVDLDASRCTVANGGRCDENSAANPSGEDRSCACDAVGQPTRPGVPTVALLALAFGGLRRRVGPVANGASS